MAGQLLEEKTKTILKLELALLFNELIAVVVN